jgi:hypothetical protein
MSAIGGFCCKSRLLPMSGVISLSATGFDRPADTIYATQALRKAQSLSGRRSRDQRCEPSQVLRDDGQDKLILGTSRATQSEPAELQDALQVCEPHLDLLALMP